MTGTSAQKSHMYKTKTSSWIAVILMILGSLELALAVIFTNVWLAIAGGVVGLAGFVVAVATNIMEDVH